MALPFRVMLITDWSIGEDELLRKVERALGAGPGVAVQHRHKSATTRDFWLEGLRLRELCERHGAPLFVNGRLDVALGLEAHLHVTSTSLPVAEVRRLLPPARLISAAVHDEAEALAASGADLAVISPVYPPGSKETDARPTLGPAGFSALAARVPCPAFALGGMTAERRREVRGDGVAVISAVLAAKDPAAAMRALLDA